MSVPAGRSLRRLVRRVRAQFEPRGLILMYHRVAALDSDPWGLAVSPEHFAEHLTLVRTLCSATSLASLATGLTRGELPRAPIVITFDDGYADNVGAALPLLTRFGIPATVFLTAGAIGSGREFWWDALERLLLEPRDLPHLLDLRQVGCPYRRELGADAQYGTAAYLHNRLWRAWQEPPTARHTMYYDLWRLMYPLPDGRKQALLEALANWAGVDSVVRPTHRLLSTEQAKQLAAAPMIEIGAHTVTHPALTELPPSTQRVEIEQSKNLLEELADRPLTCFSYPHGRYDPVTVSAVRAAGFTTACSTAAHTVSKRSDCLTLPRFQVLDWSGAEFGARIDAWRSVDG